MGDEFGRPYRVVGAADDEFRLGRAVSGELDFESEAGGGIEGPQLAFVVRLSRAPRLAAGRLGERAFAEETRARILVADQSAAGAGLHGEERGLAAIGARRAQQPIARENGVERAHEHRLDVHAGEIEVTRIGADLMAGDFAEADEPQRARPAGVVLQPDAPVQDRALRDRGASSIVARMPLTVLPMRKRLKRRIRSTSIVAGAPRRLDQPIDHGASPSSHT